MAGILVPDVRCVKRIGKGRRLSLRRPITVSYYGMASSHSHAGQRIGQTKHLGTLRDEVPESPPVTAAVNLCLGSHPHSL